MEWHPPRTAMTDTEARSIIHRKIGKIMEILEADSANATPMPLAATTTATSMTLAHRPAPTCRLPPTAETAAAAAGGKRSPTAARPAPLVTETWAAYLPEGRDAFLARGGKTICDDDLIDDRKRFGGQQRAGESEGQQKGANMDHYDGHADRHDGNECHDNNEHDDSRTDGDDDHDYVLDLRHPVVASWEDSREKEDDEDNGSIIDSAFGGELDEDEDWEQAGDADEAANDADDELDETDSESETDSTGDEEMLGGGYTLAAALALPYEVVDDDDDDSEKDEETYVLEPKYAARFKIIEDDEEVEEVDWEDQSDLLAEWGSYSDYYDEYGEGERVRKKARVV